MKRIDNWLNSGELSLEYFNNHIPKDREFRKALREQGMKTSDAYHLENILKKATTEKSPISHVDTQLRDNRWRVQLRVDVEPEEFKDLELIYSIMNLINIKEGAINNIKANFGMAHGTFSFGLPFIEGELS